MSGSMSFNHRASSDAKPVAVDTGANIHTSSATITLNDTPVHPDLAARPPELDLAIIDLSAAVGPQKP